MTMTMTMTTINYDQDYFKVNRMDSDKVEFLEKFSNVERRVMRIMFLQLKLDILSEDNPAIKIDLEKQLKKFMMIS